jgi:pseudouridine kinase
MFSYCKGEPSVCKKKKFNAVFFFCFRKLFKLLPDGWRLWKGPDRTVRFGWFCRSDGAAMTRKRILVLGGAHVDRRGRIEQETRPGASNPGQWFEEAGGGGFNAARNLARLGHAVTLVSTRGGDAAGDLVAQAAAMAGITDKPIVFLDRQTPSYTAILERNGNLVIALADMELYRLFTPRRLSVRRVQDALAAADMVLCDANLPEETLCALGDQTMALGIPLFGIAISPAKVVRFKNCLHQLEGLFMNGAEASTLAGSPEASPQAWKEALLRLGLRCGVITSGGGPALAWRRSDCISVAPPAIETLGDVTGAGDALAAGFMHAFLGASSLSTCLRSGVALAGITVQSRLATEENLTLTQLDHSLALVPEPLILS